MTVHINKFVALQIVNTVKDLCDQDINFIGQDGFILASTNESRTGVFHEIGARSIAEGVSIEVTSNDKFAGTQKGVNVPIFYNQSPIAAVGISGEPSKVRKYAHLAERITHLIIKEKEWNTYSRALTERRRFVIHSLVSKEHMDSAYLRECLDDFHMNLNSQARIIILKFEKCKDTHLVLEQKIHQFFDSLEIGLYDYYYPDKYLAIISECLFPEASGKLKNFSKLYKGALEISAGKCFNMPLLSQSYETAVTALRALRYRKGNYILYDELTLEIVITSLPKHSTDEYIAKTIAPLTKEDRLLLAVYFECDMSLSAACDKLYIHKNTLQYRLNRIHTKCGYNPRKFQDAVVLCLSIRLWQLSMDVRS